MAIAGKKLEVQVSTNGTTFTAVKELKEASISQSGNNQDVSTFDSDFVRRIQGLKDATYSLSGYYDPTDTAGQVAIRSAWLNDTALHVQILPTGATGASAGFKQEVKVSSFEVSASADGSAEVSIELEGNGTISIV